MTSRFEALSIDCADPQRLAAFWTAVLGTEILDDRGDMVETGPEASIAAIQAGPVPTQLMFVEVPEGKVGKNRLHLDVCPIDTDQETELDRLLALGATRVDVGQGEARSWVVLADPEGNEFCLLRSLHDWSD